MDAIQDTASKCQRINIPFTHTHTVDFGTLLKCKIHHDRTEPPACRTICGRGPPKGRH